MGYYRHGGPLIQGMGRWVQGAELHMDWTVGNSMTETKPILIRIK